MVKTYHVTDALKADVLKINGMDHPLNWLVSWPMIKLYYRQPCVATRRLCFTSVYFSFFFFIQLSFSETTGPILTKFSGIVYSSVV